MAPELKKKLIVKSLFPGLDQLFLQILEGGLHLLVLLVQGQGLLLNLDELCPGGLELDKVRPQVLELGVGRLQLGPEPGVVDGQDGGPLLKLGLDGGRARSPTTNLKTA